MSATSLAEMSTMKIVRARSAAFLLAGFAPLIGRIDSGVDGSTRDPKTPASAASVLKTPGHMRMLTLLEHVRDESHGANRYLGTAAVGELEKALAALPTDANDPQRCRTNVQFGTELLRVGRTEDAIAAFTLAVDRLGALAGKIPQKEATDWLFQLGTAYMRLGESQNCCLRNNQNSCLLPIQGGGLHSDKTGSENAIVWFTKALENAQPNSANYTKARWLLNIAHMTLGTYPDGVPERYRIDPKVFASDEAFPHFTDVAPKVGIAKMALAGSVVAQDFDGDGLIDLLISTSDTGGELRYYKNDGSGQFVDRTEAANLGGLYGGLNMIAADYDNDGDIDVLVLRGAWWRADGKHPKSLLQNDGHGVFTDVTFAAGLGSSMFPTQTAGFADFDNDGFLDLYIGNESDPDNPSPCELYHNNHDGTFTNVAQQAGVTNDRYTKAVSWGDYDGDRYPDLYVSNMHAPNRLYHNNKDGTFTDVAARAKVELPISSFPCWFFDFDNDGALDIFCAGFGSADAPPSVADVAASYLGLPHKGESMRLYKGDGKGGFTDVTVAQGLTRYTLPMGSNFGDLDNDGFPDIYLGTGYPFYEGLIPNVVYHNRRGKGFADVTTAGGFGELQKGHGVAFADLDNDGDQDIVESVGGAYPGDAYRPVLFENPGFGAHWLKVRLVGVKSNRDGIGALVRCDIVENGTPRSIYKTMNTGGSFGCSPLRLELGLGAATKIEKLDIYWPTSDTHQIFRDVAVDRALEIHEGADSFVVTPLKTFALAK